MIIKKSLSIITIITIIMFFSIALLESYYHNEKSKSTSPSKDTMNYPAGLYTYSVEISVNRTGDYQLNIPIPVVKNDSLMFDLANLSFLHGFGEFGLINTSHGYSLWIHSNGSLKLVAEREGCTWVDELSMMEPYCPYGRDSRAFWSYCNRSAIDQQIQINITSD